MNKEIISASDKVVKILMRYTFPGNVRQFENIIEHAFVMCSKQEIKLEHLPPEFSKAK